MHPHRCYGYLSVCLSVCPPGFTHKTRVLQCENLAIFNEVSKPLPRGLNQTNQSTGQGGDVIIITNTSWLGWSEREKPKTLRFSPSFWVTVQLETAVRTMSCWDFRSCDLHHISPVCVCVCVCVLQQVAAAVCRLQIETILMALIGNCTTPTEHTRTHNLSLSTHTPTADVILFYSAALGGAQRGSRRKQQPPTPAQKEEFILLNSSSSSSYLHISYHTTDLKDAIVGRFIWLFREMFSQMSYSFAMDVGLDIYNPQTINCNNVWWLLNQQSNPLQPFLWRLNQVC